MSQKGVGIVEKLRGNRATGFGTYSHSPPAGVRLLKGGAPRARLPRSQRRAHGGRARRRRLVRAFLTAPLAAPSSNASAAEPGCVGSEPSTLTPTEARASPETASLRPRRNRARNRTLRKRTLSKRSRHARGSHPSKKRSMLWNSRRPSTAPQLGVTSAPNQNAAPVRPHSSGKPESAARRTFSVLGVPIP